MGYLTQAQQADAAAKLEAEWRDRYSKLSALQREFGTVERYLEYKRRSITTDAALADEFLQDVRSIEANQTAAIQQESFRRARHMEALKAGSTPPKNEAEAAAAAE